MAELVLGVAGAAVAGIPGLGITALTGFQIGVTLGSLLFPPEGPHLDRGRVDEIRIQGASQGNPIALVYGRNRVAGTIIWATGITETSSTSSSGGKGGGGGSTVTDYSYSTNLAVAICEGTLTKVRRIWANEKVIYDWRTGGSPTLAAWLDSAKVRVYLGNQTTADAAIEADKGVGNVPAHKGIAYVVFEDFPLKEVGNQVPNFTFEVETSHANLKVAMEDLAGRVGLTSTEYDFTALSSYPTRGMVVSARTEAARVMETFAKANFFEIVETGGVIKAVVRNGSSVLTIPADDIGAGADDQVMPYVETVRAEESELPREFTVTYQSEAADFQQWTQTARRTVRWSENQDQVSFPMGLGDSYARYLADAFLMERWAARASHTFFLSYEYLRLDPGDVVTVPDEGGGTRAVRILEMSMGLLAQIEVKAVDDDPIIYVDPGLPASIPDTGGQGVDASATADLVVFETNAPYDNLADDCHLGFVAGRSAAGWKGGDAQTDPVLQREGWGTARTLAEFGSSCQFGYTTADAFGILGTSTPIGGAGLYDLPYFLDTVNTVRVTMTNGTLASCTYDEMVQEGRNLCLVGDEILQFQTATLVSGSTYTLSNLLRFRRGTEHLLCGVLQGSWGHAQGERFILFNNKVKNFAYDESAIGIVQNFRLIEDGKDYSGGLPPYTEPLTLAGLSRKPYGPCDLKYSGDRSGGAADITLSWTRRVRKRGNLYNYQEAPLDEASENYVVEIWPDDLSDIINSYSVSGATSFLYTVAMQTADGTTGDFQFVVRQVSSEAGIGNGHPSLPKFVTITNDLDY